MDKEEATAKLFAALQNCDATAAKTAIESGANVNSRNDGLQTPLHLAAAINDAYLAALLIAKGADINAKDIWDKTPSQIAAERGYLKLAKIIKAADGVHKRLPRIGYRFPVTLGEDDHTNRIAGERKDKGPPQVGG